MLTSRWCTSWIFAIEEVRCRSILALRPHPIPPQIAASSNGASINIPLQQFAPYTAHYNITLYFNGNPVASSGGTYNGNSNDFNTSLNTGSNWNSSSFSASVNQGGAQTSGDGGSGCV